MVLLTVLVVLAAIITALVAIARWLLKPTHKERTVLSSSADIVEKQGGTKRSPMQA